jgi:hypothetical protein
MAKDMSMRYSILSIFIFALICFGIAISQNTSYSHRTTSKGAEIKAKPEAIHFGGRFITSTGILRVLVIFVRFAGDNETSATWPDPEILPDWARHFVDTDYRPDGKYYRGLVSHYFYDNSYGKLHVIGDVYYVTTDSIEDYYRRLAFGPSANPAKARAAIELEMFNKLDKPPYNVDFHRYDNWASGSSFNHPNRPDGSLDMCWIITRNLHMDELPGRASLRIDVALLDCPSLYRRGVLIKGHDYSLPGSGIGCFADYLNRKINTSSAANGEISLVNVVAHEMTHYFYGYGHFADLFSVANLAPRRSTSNMKTYADGFRSEYSGYEKWRLGWMQPTTVTSAGDTYVLWDLASTMDSTKNRLLKIDIPGTSQYFLVENRQWISPFEPRYNETSGPYGKLRPGILIYQMIREYDNLPSCQVQKINADGRFRWKMLYHGPNNRDWTDDVIDKDIADRERGYTESERIYIQGYPNESWLAEWHPGTKTPYGGGPYRTIYSHNGLYETGDLQGDSLDLYQVGDVLTPWSNCASHKWDDTIFSATTIGVEVKSYDPEQKTFTLAMRLTNPEELAPSRPQDVHGTFIDSDSVLIGWSRNIEPDAAGYDLYRSIYFDGTSFSYVKVNSSLLTSTSFIDNPSIPYGVSTDKDIFWRYHVRAKDRQGKSSVPSEDIWLQIVGNRSRSEHQ